ncbi:MAG: protein kinase domain-containing protein [Solirubrobacteraceae bacterium]
MLDRYRLHRRLGAGGFGVVWLAYDERLEREVAVKIVPGDRVVGGRFEREARAAARLAHPGIVTLYEAAVDERDAYLVSELVRGPTLAQLLELGRLSDREIFAIGIALCDALSHAHSQGIVHRDVKPSNVLVPESPPSPAQAAKLTDFGVARVIDAHSASAGEALTHAGEVIGTAAYMAPEQAQGREAGASADLFSLAVVLYEALTGVNPVKAIRARMATTSHRHVPHPVPLRRRRRDLPLPLTRGIDRALHPRPHERGSLGDLRRALSAAIEPLDHRPGSLASPRRARREVAAGPQDDAPRAQERDGARIRLHPPWLARGLSALAAGLLTAWLARHVPAPGAVAEPMAGVLGAAAILALPRLGWLAIVTSTAIAAVLAHRSGEALVLVIGGAVPVVLAPSAPTIWALGALAPALGMLGLAGAWPGVAARAATVPRRAALGAVGWLWLVLAIPLAGSDLYLRRPQDTPARAVWIDSLHQTVRHVLGPLLTTGTLAPAGVWALAAVVLPWLLGRRSARLNLVLAVAWAAAVAGATISVLGAVESGDRGPAASTVIVGAALSAVLALAGTWRRPGWRRDDRSHPDPRLA